MRQALLVIRYIYKNNPWYAFLWVLFQAMLYQCFKRLSKEIVSKTLMNGKKIFLFPKSPISSAFIYTECPDKEEVMALRAFADHNTIFIDVGANIGNYCLLLSDIVKEVFAFEAHPVTAKFCKMNFLLNGISEDHVINKAVSFNSELKHFSNTGNASPINSCVNNDKDDAIMVPAITLDDFFQKMEFPSSVHFILKVDVEGFEHDVFFGAKAFFSSQQVKAIIFETFSPNMSDIVSFLEKQKYQMRPIGENNMLAWR